MNQSLIRTAVVAVVAMAAISAAARDIEDSTPTPFPIISTEISGSDLAFFTGAGPQMALLAQLSELAAKRAVAPEVQAEAAMLSKEQSAAAARLQQLAASKNVPLAADPDDPGKQVLQNLKKLDGVRFDKSFLDAQQDAQDALETSLQSGASSTDPDIKSLAEADLQTLKQERDRLRKLGL